MRSLMRRLLLPFLLAFAPVPAAAQELQSDEQALPPSLARGASEYARNHRLSEAEGLQRLRAQAKSVAVTDQIRERYAGRLAGIAIEHEPDFLIRVRLTGDAPVAARTIQAGGMAVPILFETGAAATRTQILAAMDRHRDAIRAIVDHDGIRFYAHMRRRSRTGSPRSRGYPYSCGC